VPATILDHSLGGAFATALALIADLPLTKTEKAKAVRYLLRKMEALAVSQAKTLNQGGTNPTILGRPQSSPREDGPA
jgi:hypothetical protein